MFTEIVHCKKAEEHDGHRYVTPVAKYCSGETVCGEVVHSSHTDMLPTEVYCDGVCKCGIPGMGVHGPGEHK